MIKKLSYESYVINLKRRPDRLKIFMKQCPIKNVIVEYAFDGLHPKNENQEDVANMEKFKNFRPGEIGCFISHIRLYKKLVNSNLDYIIIFEDDAIFCDMFKKKFIKCLSEIKNNIDGILYFGGRFNSNFMMPHEYFIEYSSSILKHKFTKSEYSWSVRTTHGYIIFKKTAKLLLDIFNNSKTINCAIDHWIINNLVENNCNIYDTKPLLCHSPIDSNSDIR
jgi:glycosyl transferase family 25